MNIDIYQSVPQAGDCTKLYRYIFEMKKVGGYVPGTYVHVYTSLVRTLTGMSPHVGNYTKLYRYICTPLLYQIHIVKLWKIGYRPSPPPANIIIPRNTIGGEQKSGCSREA